jgi:hypothetical protein
MTGSVAIDREKGGITGYTLRARLGRAASRLKPFLVDL